METEVKQSSDIVYRISAWVVANRKQLIIIAVVLAVAGVGASLYSWNSNRREAEANNALSELKPTPSKTGNGTPVAADAYLKVADAYTGTSASARARLLGAGALFESGKFKEAQSEFDKFLQENQESPLTSEAEMGVAASLEAQGKIQEATSKYKEFSDRHPGVSQAKSALARLYVEQNKPELAFKLYQDLMATRNNDTWTEEAQVQAAELLAKYPKLREPSPVTASQPPAMGLSSTNKAVTNLTIGKP
ncbi:MAG: Tetratricopeptide 2 repeat protein [Pedosphaera sp.]|nr:Tetratricopeptide 2 repeat protein [Pedosphaera sp.]